MTMLTPRFGLSHFGGTVPGSIFDDGGKFTGRDRRVLDRVLAAFETHDHSGGVRLGNPDEPPMVNFHAGLGELDPGTTFYYRFAYVDKYGLETAASVEVSASTPDPIPIPAQPRLVEVTPTGTEGLEEGLYYFALTAHGGGGETPLSAPQLVNLADVANIEVYLEEALPAEATSVSVWRQGGNDGGFTRLAEVPIPADIATEPLFTDDGSIASDPCPCSPEQMPPDENTTNADGAIHIVIPEMWGARRWRLYRSTEPGSYPAASMLVERWDDETDYLEYLDTGLRSLQPGSPLSISQTLRPSTKVGGGGGGGTGHIFVPGPEYTSDGAQVVDLWSLIATIEGQLETRPTGLSTPVDSAGTIVLVDENDDSWRVTTDSDGTLVTEENAVTADSDQIFSYDGGPDLLTSDPMVTWRLGVTVDGELTTEGDAVPGADALYLRPRSSEPEAPATGGVFYMVGEELRFKNAAGVVTVLA